jgi:excinuclease ABC subunit C
MNDLTIPCINFEMGRCLGPCSEEVDPARYREIVHQVRMFLEGKNRDLVKRLKERMEEESEKLNFEGAAKIRDQLTHIERVIEKQKIVSQDFLDQDVTGFYRQDHRVILYLLFVRAGKLLGGRGFGLPSSGLPDEEILYSFLHQYYRDGKYIPDQILIPMTIPEQGPVEEELSDLKGKRVRILLPMRGDKKQLLEMACENAEKYLSKETDEKADRQKLLESLRERLHLGRIPRRIEGFDISNLQGGDAVGSMVSFQDGKPDKEGYRHFKIKTIEGADDYGMMYEVLLRRYRKALEENDFPDLVLLDGGKGQLNVAVEVFKELNLKTVDLISLAKERTVDGSDSSGTEKTEEKVFLPQHKAPVILGRHSSLLHFLDRVRDEAHRFAITYHKKIRGRETIKSVLREIPGIGRVRQRELIKFFGSPEKIKEASPGELAKAPKMNSKSAKIVYDFFRSAQEKESNRETAVSDDL